MKLPAATFERLPGECILRHLTPDELDGLLAHAVSRRYRRGESVIGRGDPGDSLMIVLSGTLRACVQTAQGREIVLDYLGPGALIGELSVFDGRPRAASVIAHEAAELLVVQRRDILPFLERTPGAAARIIALLCDRLRRTNMLVEDNATAAMRPRLARGLLRLTESHGERSAEGVRVRFPISQEELGNYVLLARENVNRQLREWADAGYVALSRNGVAVLDAEALETIAEGID